MGTTKIKTMSREQVKKELKEALKEVKDKRTRKWVCDELFHHIDPSGSVSTSCSTICAFTGSWAGSRKTSTMM